MVKNTQKTQTPKKSHSTSPRNSIGAEDGLIELILEQNKILNGILDALTKSKSPFM